MPSFLRHVWISTMQIPKMTKIGKMSVSHYKSHFSMCQNSVSATEKNNAMSRPKLVVL